MTCPFSQLTGFKEKSYYDNNFRLSKETAPAFARQQTLVFASSVWSATGSVTLSASPDPSHVCCIGANERISITGGYQLTEDTTCTWDIYTWASWCSIVIFDFDGAKSYDWISPYRIGTAWPISWSINTANYPPGSKHTLSVSIVDLNSDGSRGGTIAEDSVTFTICTGQIDEGCPQQPACPDCGNQCPTNTPLGSSGNYVSGNLYHDQTLFQTPNSKLPFDFTIAYNSLDTYTGPLGKAWMHSFNANIIKQGSTITLMKSDGKRITFSSAASTGANTYFPDTKTGEHSVIISSADTYTLTEKDGTTYTFNSKGRLTSIQDLNQTTTALSYTGD
ncbi:MAG: hypothetical protein HY026_01035, partial [Deltaproteobacteria bacterium]|nr:hypothetical protein [Deltaproteobacteria bacterium]